MDDEAWFTSNLREVRREPYFLEQLAALGIADEQLEEALAGLDFSLAKHPEIFPKAPGTPFSRAILRVYPDTPPLRIFFTYDAVQVRLHLVEFAGPE